MKLFYFLMLIAVFNSSFAQSDTSLVYMAKDGHETTKDSAYTLMKFYQQNNVWHGKEVYIKNGTLKSDGDYADKSVKIPIGSFNNYTEEGKLSFTASYTNGKPTEANYFYKSGNKKSWASFDDKGNVKDQKGWDETGKEIRNYIVMKPAAYKGGEQGWQRYLQKNLNGNVAIDAGVPAGEYSVELTFKVDAIGYISNVKTISVPAKCKPCGGEAMRVIENSRDWEPAIQQNEPVAYYLKQVITFKVVEEKKKKN